MSVRAENWTVFNNIDELSEQLTNDILRVAECSIRLNNQFKIVLTGGSSILGVYSLLNDSDSYWDRWHVYMGDERCLPVGDSDRNDHTIEKTWLKNNQIPRENIHFIRAELGPNIGALHYEEILKSVESFDLVLLSVGEDGHIASLFPQHSYGRDKNVVVETNSPKYPKERISMSYLRLSRSKNTFIIANGHSKRNAVKAWLSGEGIPVCRADGPLTHVYACKDVLTA